MTSTARSSGEGTSERTGVWQLRARDTTGAVMLDGWYDTLTIRRHAAGGDLVPDTDGLIGGRYRGRLDPTGHYLPSARPFIPDEVAEVADLSAALDDLLPPLPPGPLRPGATWQDAGLTITRLADTVAQGRTLLHYSVNLQRRANETTPRGDTVPVALTQTTTEQGSFLWDPALGLLARQRKIEVETSIPAGGRIRAPVRSRIVQYIEVTRLARSSCR